MFDLFLVLFNYLINLNEIEKGEIEPSIYRVGWELQFLVCRSYYGSVTGRQPR